MKCSTRSECARGLSRNSLASAFLALVGSILAGCVPISPEKNGTPQLLPCHKFGFAHWREFRFGLDPSPDDLFATVERLYEIDREQVEVETYPDGQIHKVLWTDNSASYYAAFGHDGGFELLEVHWGHEKSTLAQVTDCLGPAKIRDYTHKGETHRVWADDEPGESRYPGQVTMLLISGISSPSSGSSLQSVQQEQRVRQLSVIPFSIPKQIIENPEPFPCAKFTVSHWREFRFGVDFRADAFATVVSLWGTNKDEIAFGKTPDWKGNSLEWNDAAEEIYYRALFTILGQLDRIQVEFIPVPTLGQVIDCLGPPDFYVANGGPRSEATSLQLWYVEQGFVTRGNVFHFGFASLWQKPLKTIPPSFGIGSLLILPAGIEEMTRLFDYTDEDGSPVLCIFKPWPSSIEAMEISEEPFFACHYSDSG